MKAIAMGCGSIELKRAYPRVVLNLTNRRPYRNFGAMLALVNGNPTVDHSSF